jgi:hypothetical protein
VGDPFTSTNIFAIEMHCMIQPRHLLPKPILAMTSLIYSHQTESKALWKSSLKRYPLPFLFFMKLIASLAIKWKKKLFYLKFILPLNFQCLEQ